jgi:hypothetical protein
MRHVQFVLFTTKLTKDTKGSDILNSELRALRVLRGEYFLSYLVAASACKSFVVKTSSQQSRKNQSSRPDLTLNSERRERLNP